MDNLKTLDEFSAYFDDIWLFQLDEGQRCCLWAYDNDQGTLTPLDDSIVPKSEIHGSNDAEIWLVSNVHCDWKLRKTIMETQVNLYLDVIATLIVKCSAVNSLNQSVSKESAIKLTDFVKDKFV
ncbi:hypothetical protein LH715_004413 [Vibrio vulnificus]|nr:hypothetical protein [Vibrio vulnificus]EJB0234574.1 hypothetical protein [Vibrio vulnificus]